MLLHLSHLCHFSHKKISSAFDKARHGQPDKTSRKNSTSTFSFDEPTERKKVLKRVKLGIKTSASHETDKFFIVASGQSCRWDGVKRDGIIKGKRQRKLAREGEMRRGVGGGERQVR